MEYKYTLIITQYYHSRHFFIVEYTNDFLNKYKAFCTELMEYKRSEGNERDLYCGDIDYQLENGHKEIRRRYNINDSGDIYLLNSDSANYLAGETRSYQRDSIRESKGYQKKSLLNEIGEHHDYSVISNIVKNHFELA